jgi:membrane protease YdiL (CAAX protease family)
LGHVATIHDPGRLAVFFPSLVFGWLRARTGGVGAAIAFHALCNLFSESLMRGYGLG